LRFSDQFQQQYQVQSILGEGGMGRVVLATDLALSRPVAIKLLAELDESDGGLMRQRFEEEARVCAQLKHPNIVRLLTTGFEGGCPFLVFEFIEGHDVAKELVQCGRLPVDRALAIAAATLEGLQYAHEHGIVHRDVKPANILLRADGGEPMLMDFGVAKASSRTTFKTQANLILGTPLYMAPELIRREELGPPVDVYALGCALFELLTGQPPYMAKSDIAILEMQLHGEVPRLRAVRSELPQALEDVVLCAMSKDLAVRFKTARAMADAVAELRSGSGRPVLTARELHAPPPRSRPDPAGRRTHSEVAPRVANPGSRGTPRAGGSTEAVPSKPGAGRGPVPARSRPTVIASRGDVEAPEVPSAVSSARRTRRAAVVAAAMLIALVAGAALSFSRGGVSDVSLVFRPDGLQIQWRTPAQCVGRVFHREVDGAEAVKPDGAPARAVQHEGMSALQEQGPGHQHTLALRAMRPGERVLVSIADARGASAWARVLLVPPSRYARQQADAGATVARVVAQTGRVSHAKLIAQTAAGERLTVQPVAPDSPELGFEAPCAPEDLTEGSQVEAEQSPGVRIEMPVETMSGAAASLLAKLDRVKIPTELRRLAARSAYMPNLDFPHMGRSHATYTLDEVRAKRQARAATAPTRGEVVRYLEKDGLNAAIERFRPHAQAWFTATGVPEEQKLLLYAGLLDIQQLDLLILFQRESDGLGIAQLYESLVKYEHHIRLHPMEDALPALLPGEVRVNDGTAWCVDHYDDWMNLQIWLDTATIFRAVVKGEIPDGEEAAKKVFQIRRTFPLELPAGAAAAGTAELRAEVAILGSTYFFEVVFPGRGRRPPFRVRLCQPGSDVWLHAMDDYDPPLKFPIQYGEIVARFPARYLPEGKSSVEVQFRHLGGLAPRELSKLPRVSVLRYLNVRAVRGGS
jgi:serine/threonine protein kinase